MNKIQLFNDDCCSILKNFKIEKPIDCVVADLPYFKIVKNSFDNQWNTIDEYLLFVKNILFKINALIKDNANILLFCSRQNMRQIGNICIDEIGWADIRTIIWARKRNFNNTRGKALASGYEPILHFCKSKNGNGTFNNIKIKINNERPEYKTGILKDGITLSDVWTDIPALPHNAKEKVNHPTQKPIKLMERIISIYTNKNDTVLDFCMGSGSTGVACKNLNRNFIGIEIDNEYFNIAKKRLT